jgi:hypothetical protein
VAAPGDQDAAPPRGQGEAILTGEEEVRLAAQVPAAGPGDEDDDAEDTPAENAGQADLAPDSAGRTAGLADLPRLTPAHEPASHSRCSQSG